jgi:hypothetical protein
MNYSMTEFPIILNDRRWEIQIFWNNQWHTIETELFAKPIKRFEKLSNVVSTGNNIKIRMLEIYSLTTINNVTPISIEETETNQNPQIKNIKKKSETLL